MDGLASVFGWDLDSEESEAAGLEIAEVILLHKAWLESKAKG